MIERNHLTRRYLSKVRTRNLPFLGKTFLSTNSSFPPINLYDIKSCFIYLNIPKASCQKSNSLKHTIKSSNLVEQYPERREKSTIVLILMRVARHAQTLLGLDFQLFRSLLGNHLLYALSLHQQANKYYDVCQYCLHLSGG